MSIKIKISTACVYKECEVKMKMVQKQWLKIKYSLSCNMSFSWEVYLGGIFQVGVVGTPIPQVEKSLEYHRSIMMT